MAKTFALNFRIDAAMGSSFGNAFAGANTKVAQLGAKIMRLEQAQGKVDRFRGLKNNLRETEHQLDATQREAKRLASELKKAGNDKTLQKSFDQTIAKAKRLKTQINQQRTSLQKARTEMSKSGVSLQNLSQQHSQLTSSINKSRLAQERLNRVMAKQKRNEALRSKVQGQVPGAIAAVGAIALPVKAAIDFEAAMVDVRKNVKGLDSDAKFKQMDRDIRSIAKSSPLSASGIADLVSAGGKIGLNADKALEFAKASEAMGVAFELGPQEAGQIIGKISSSMGLSIPQVRELGDAMNFVGDNTASNAKNLADIVQRVGALASTSGLAGEKLVALAAIMDSAAPNPEMAATATKNLLLALTEGSKASAPAKKAFQEIGFSATELAERMQTDAKGTIMDVFKAINDLPKAEQAGILKEIFGKESIGPIAPMLKNLKNAEKVFGLVAKKQNFLGSATDEYKRKVGTTKAQLEIFMGRMAVMGDTIGRVLLPPLNTAVGILGNMFNAIGALAERFPFMTSLIVMSATALVGLKLASMGAMLGFSFLSDGIIIAKNLGSTLLTVGRVVLPFLIGGLKALWAVMLANPIIAVVAIIIAAIIIFWKPLKKFFLWLWEGIKVVFAKVRDFIKLGFSFSPLGMIIKHWDPIKKFFLGLWGFVVNLFKKGLSFIKKGLAFSPLGLLLKAAGLFSGKQSKLGAALGPNQQVGPKRAQRIKPLSPNNQNKNSITVSPNITVNGDTDPKQVKAAVENSLVDSEDRLKVLLDEKLQGNGRLSFG